MNQLILGSIISIVGIISLIGIPYGVALALGYDDKITEIPQYNCYILNTQFETWKYDVIITKELQKEWVKKECHLEEIYEAEKEKQRMIDDDQLEKKFMDEWEERQNNNNVQEKEN